MGARFRSWWQQIKQHPFIVAGIIVVSVLLIALIVVEVRANGTGFAGKTLWDWLQFLAALAIPVVVGFGAVWFTARQNHDREIAKDIRFDAALQGYLDKMTELLLHENLSKSQRHDVVANIAQTSTLVFLINLDPLRKGFVIIFLAASGLINRSGKIIDLSFADLRRVNLRHRHTQKLDGISLEGAILWEADFSGALLTNVNFQRADFKIC
jgi:hypothetical protein